MSLRDLGWALSAAGGPLAVGGPRRTRLVLALRTDPQRVYQRALAYFTEAELAEAFAATRGVASPTQLRAFLRRDPRDLLGQFRALAPPRPPIIMQRWNSRRLALAAAMLAITVVAGYGTVRAFIPGPAGLGADPPRCGTGAEDDRGAGAAVINAIHNATGARIRDFPATPDKLLATLEALDS